MSEQERMVRASMAQPRVILADPGVQVGQEPVEGRCATCRERRPANGSNVCWRCEQLNAIKPQPAPLARVGDVIAHGETIPANVRVLRDKVNDLWERQRGGWILARYDGTATTEQERADTEPADDARLLLFWAPLTVVEVDPEPQPAEPDHPWTPRVGSVPGCNARAGAADGLPCAFPESAHLTLKEWNRRASIARGCCGMTAVHMAYCPQFTVDGLHEAVELPAESGPVVLSLPQVPPGTVALVGDSSGARFLPTGTAWAYDQSPTGVIALGGLLDAERSVTVEFAPPCEPRTWPRLVDEATSDLPDVVDVIGDGRWHRLTEPGAEHLYARPGHEDNWRLSLRGLREWGEVREVLT